MLRLHQTLIRLRSEDPSFVAGAIRATALGPDTLGFALERSGCWAIVHLRGAVTVDLPAHRGTGAAEIILTTESADFATDPLPIRFDSTPESYRVGFHRPGALIVAGLLPDSLSSSALR